MIDRSRLVLRSSIAISFFMIASVVFGGELSEDIVRKTASPMVENRIVDGLSIGYLDGDRYGTVHLGQANDAKKTADNSTIYEIGSISKVFTGLLLADAAVQGKINLFTPAETKNSAGIHFPAYQGRAVKWIDLSTHRSGLPRLPDNLPVVDLVDPYRDYDSKKAAAFLKGFKPTHKPGQLQEYSNIGTAVLGYLLAQNAGMNYEALLQERIAKPLKLMDCVVSLDADRMQRVATPHSKVGATTPLWELADLPGAGGIRTTLRDMMRFVKAQLNPPDDGLGEAIELAWKLHSEADESGPATGLGWMIAGDGQTRWHNGGTGGSTATVYVNRKLQRAVIVLCNTQVGEEVDGLAQRLLTNADTTDKEPKSKDATATKSKQPVIDSKHRQRLIGCYQLAPTFILTVKDDDGRMTVQATNQPALEVLPDSPNRWSNQAVQATLEFVLPASGPAKSLILHQNGVKQTARRIE